jgi:putative S-adenosyl-L-methionine-dependent methyltransferase
MDVDLRPVKKLRESAAVRSALGPIMEAVCASSADLSRLRVVCDWIQYKKNFREPVAGRPIADEGTEIAVDLRRCDDLAAESLAAAVKQALDEPPGVALEPWVPGRDSCIWRFNELYWQALSGWEQATGREYEQSLPGGESDARNIDAARELILELFRIWDSMDARRALPEDLYILELGVGNGNQARTWLDEFLQLDARHGRDYYRRLRYLMADYSPHVLDRARQAVAHHGEHVSALVVEATRPGVTLGFLAGKAFLVYISNVYDNLPTDEVACIRGRMYQVQTQAYLTDDDAELIATRHQVADRGDLVPLIDRLLRIGPELLSESAPERFKDPDQAVAFWQATWDALRLKERYAPLEGLDRYQLGPSLTGEILRPLLEGQGDIRMHVSNGAVSSFIGTLPLLHPYGRVQCHDLFLTGSEQYRDGFYGPGKYDGSVVNWVNGPLLQLVASRRGFGVQFAPFRQRTGSNITTLTAQARD